MKNFTYVSAAILAIALAGPASAQSAGTSAKTTTDAADSRTDATASAKGEVSSTPATRKMGNKNNRSQDGTSEIGGGSMHGTQSTQAQGMGAAGTGLGGSKSVQH